MFQLLLESQDQVIYKLFCCLQKQNPCPLEELAAQLHKNKYSVQRSIQLWQQNALNRHTGVAFYLKKQIVKGIYADEHAALFLTTLLHRSETFQLLNKLLLDPYRSATSLQRSMHLSSSSFQRRVHCLQTFLDFYQLKVSFMQAPSLKGDEAQIRWLALLTSLLSDPPFEQQPTTWFDRYEELHEIRLNQGCALATNLATTCAHYYPASFQLDDRGLLFLWRQLTGLEKIWVYADIHATVSFALYAHTTLAPAALRKVQQEIHRVHCLCSFFTGRLPLDPGLSVSEESRRLTQSFQYLLPDYEHLLQKHPELPLIYQQFFNYYRNQEDVLLVSED